MIPVYYRKDGIEIPCGWSIVTKKRKGEYFSYNGAKYKIIEKTSRKLVVE